MPSGAPSSDDSFSLAEMPWYIWLMVGVAVLGVLVCIILGVMALCKEKEGKAAPYPREGSTHSRYEYGSRATPDRVNPIEHQFPKHHASPSRQPQQPPSPQPLQPTFTFTDIEKQPVDNQV